MAELMAMFLPRQIAFGGVQMQTQWLHTSGRGRCSTQDTGEYSNLIWAPCTLVSCTIHHQEEPQTEQMLFDFYWDLPSLVDVQEDVQVQTHALPYPSPEKCKLQRFGQCVLNSLIVSRNQAANGWWVHCYCRSVFARCSPEAALEASAWQVYATHQDPGRNPVLSAELQFNEQK